MLRSCDTARSEKESGLVYFPNYTERECVPHRLDVNRSVWFIPGLEGDSPRSPVVLSESVMEDSRDILELSDVFVSDRRNRENRCPIEVDGMPSCVSRPVILQPCN
jgi:hypothetical protein